MSGLALGVRDRAFRMVLGGFEPGGVRAALDSAAAELERVRGEIAQLQQQHTEALAEIERIAALERSLVRACVAAEEDAQIRSAAARRYAARIIGAAQHQAAARLEAPARERDQLVREIEEMRVARGRAAEALEQLLAQLDGAAHRAADVASSDVEATGDAAARAAGVGESEAVLAVAPAGPVAGAIHPPYRAGGSATTAAAARPSATSPTPREAPARRRVRAPIAAGAAAAVLLVFQGSAGEPPARRSSPEIAAAGMTPIAPAAPVAAAHDGASPPQPHAKTTLDASAGAPAAGGLTMRITPLRRCWVRVIVDNRTDAREIMPGEDIRLVAERAIVLRVGDAGALSIEVNGRVLPPLGEDGQVVERRFTAPGK